MATTNLNIYRQGTTPGDKSFNELGLGHITAK